jgi:L-cysteine desulfidase
LSQVISINKIKPLFDLVIKYNLAIAKEGLINKYGVNIGQNIQTNINNGFYGNDVRNLSASFTAAASDARMGGCSLPVMTTAGSGNVGLTSSLPIIIYAQQFNKDEEQLYRALFFSHLTTIYIKSKIGRLSAYCGPMCASAGVAGGLGILSNATYETITNAITNTLAGVSGLLCDGAKSSCAIKIANATYAAYDGIAIAIADRVVLSGEGIVSNNIEQTIDNITEIAKEGMQITDETILKIMLR